MARITFKGLAEYELQLSRLGAETEQIAGKAIYAGARIIADEIRSNIEGLVAVNDVEGLVAYQMKTPPPLTKKAKQGLLDGLGISPLGDENGYLNVKIGFDGYNQLKTKKYPKGQPNVMIARVTESGTSTAIKQPFVRTAVNAKKPEAEETMKTIVDEEIKKIMNK